MDPESTINQSSNKQIEICRYCSRDLPDGFVCACNANNDDDGATKVEISPHTKSEINRYLYCYRKTKQKKIRWIFCHCCNQQNELNSSKCTQCGNSLIFNKENELQLIPMDSAWRTDQSVDRGLRYNPNGLTSTCMHTYRYFVGNISISIYTPHCTENFVSYFIYISIGNPHQKTGKIIFQMIRFTKRQIRHLSNFGPFMMYPERRSRIVFEENHIDYHRPEGAARMVLRGVGRLMAEKDDNGNVIHCYDQGQNAVGFPIITSINPPKRFKKGIIESSQIAPKARKFVEKHLYTHYAARFQQLAALLDGGADIIFSGVSSVDYQRNRTLYCKPPDINQTVFHHQLGMAEWSTITDTYKCVIQKFIENLCSRYNYITSVRQVAYTEPKCM